MFENMNTTLKFSSAYHLEIDGQSKIDDSIVLDLLKCYVHEYKHKWVKYLSLVEFVHHTVHSLMG